MPLWEHEELLCACCGLVWHNTMDLDQWLEKVKGGNYLLEDELKQLCEYVSAGE